MATTRTPRKTPKPTLVRLLQIRIAMVAIGAPVLRGQGQAGMVEAARNYLARLDLSKFSIDIVDSEAVFLKAPNRHTKKLADKFSDKGRGNWGAARKSLNLFLRDVVESRSLCDKYKLQHIEKWLEVPLDSHVAGGLSGFDPDLRRNHRWPGVRYLEKGVSDKYQAAASVLAKKCGCSRVALDLYLWRGEQINELLPTGAH